MFYDGVQLIPPFTKELSEKKIRTNFSIPDRDETFLMTLTSLFYKRWPDFRVELMSARPNSDQIMGYLIKANKEALNFHFITYTGNPDAYLTGEYKPLTNLEVFIKAKLGKTIYVRRFEDRNLIAFFGDGFNLSCLHFLQSFIPLYFPSFFSNIPKTGIDHDIIFSLSNNDSTAYKKAIETILEDDELKHYLLREQLLGFEKNIRFKKYSDATAEVTRLNDSLQNYLTEYRKLCEKKNEASAYADGLKYAWEQAENESEFEEYLCENNSLTNICINGSHIQFIVKTFVNPYLPEDWESLSNRGRIFEGYENINSYVGDPENLKLLLDNVFSDKHTLKLRICGYIDMDVLGTHCKSFTNYSYTDANPHLKNYVPNAHLQSHNCFGQNMSDILNMLNDGDHIGAVECCINVVKRMNVTESASFDPFVKSIIKCRGKCFVSEEDGREMTPTEAIEYLKEKMNETASDSDGEAVVA